MSFLQLWIKTVKLEKKKRQQKPNKCDNYKTPVGSKMGNIYLPGCIVYMAVGWIYIILHEIPALWVLIVPCTP